MSALSRSQVMVLPATQGGEGDDHPTMSANFTCVAVERGGNNLNGLIDSWEGCRESRRCSRDTSPESYILVYED